MVPTFLTSCVVSLANCCKKFAISAMYLVTELDLMDLLEIAWPVAKNTEYIANMQMTPMGESLIRGNISSMSVASCSVEF